ncbi:MAG: peptidoglycan recognition family protein [Phycisphaeraceae bacterium]
MSMTRRQMIWTGMTGLSGLVLAAGGCQMPQTASSDRPGPLWPGDVNRPIPSGDPLRPEPPRVATPNPPTTPTSPPAVAGPIRAIPRSSWAKADPISSRVNQMGSVGMITVHHEGWTPVYFDDTSTTAERLDSIRRSHLERLRAGDIGYHFVVDRAGRIWQGRDLGYQGAHVREHNEHNIGIMCLGNFDKQQPSTAQLTSLRATLLALMKQYRLASNKVYTHQELNKTDCPGRVLQAHMVQLRRNGLG